MLVWIAETITRYAKSEWNFLPNWKVLDAELTKGKINMNQQLEPIKVLIDWKEVFAAVILFYLLQFMDLYYLNI